MKHTDARRQSIIYCYLLGV